MRWWRDLLAGALALIFVATLLPAPGRNNREFRPFDDIGPAFRHPFVFGDSVPVIANVLLFVPLGVALQSRRWSFARTVLSGCVLSVAIESAQLVIPGRTTSFDDALLNTIGAALGWLVSVAAWRRLRSRPRASSAPAAAGAPSSEPPSRANRRA